MLALLKKEIDLAEIENRIAEFWQETNIYTYTPTDKDIFSVDTPPPYVSAAHLHIGHAMSYTQAEIIVRYKRMQGFNIFYPMGFDDNGLPTERFVEQHYAIDKNKISRGDFRALCMQETAKGAQSYEKLWKALGLSVDWQLRYSTIDLRCQETAQKSFIDLYKKGLIYRANDPVLWDTQLETSLAQADLETLSRTGKMVDVQFLSETQEPLIISTTRPELIPACVALFFHPEDTRYRHLCQSQAVVPLFEYTVPILTSTDVDPNFGTGLMMVSTFGDSEDVKKWKQYQLQTRVVLTSKGRMNDLAGIYAGLSITEARKRIIEDLSAQHLLKAEKTVEQTVAVGERSQAPIEFIMTPQWFIKVLDQKERLIQRTETLEWFPKWMKVRLDQWIEGLKYDWNISRQRFYGVPFPVWYVLETGDIIIADEQDLPVDPTETSPPLWAQEKYKGCTIVPETAVMDTWMTSSLSPLIHANWINKDGWKGNTQIYPMSLRVQAFEIIRTWLFYTLIKSEYHTETLPWKTVMISGWGLNEQGKKISKRDLEKYTDASGYNRYDPYALIQKYGADAVRYWAASSQLGHDLRFQERDIKDGKKIVVKLWNVARMACMYINHLDYTRPALALNERCLEDQWTLQLLNTVVEKVTQCFEIYDFATAKDILNKFFWGVYCDDYLELIKSRFWKEFEWSDKDRESAQWTLYESLHILLKLFAPFIPYITEEIYQQMNRFGEDVPSLHCAPWPIAKTGQSFVQPEMELLQTILVKSRQFRSEQKIGATTLLAEIIIDAPALQYEHLKEIKPAIQGAARASKLTLNPLQNNSMQTDINIVLIPYTQGEAPKPTIVDGIQFE